MQAQFSQIRPAAVTIPVAPRMPLYQPGAPGLGQQLFYGQGPPAIIPPQVIAIFLFQRLLFYVHTWESYFKLTFAYLFFQALFACLLYG